MVGSDHKNDEDVSLPRYSKLDQMPEVAFWCNRLPICGMGEIIYCFFFFFSPPCRILDIICKCDFVKAVSLGVQKFQNYCILQIAHVL